jgi:hypothetical protein
MNYTTLQARVASELLREDLTAEIATWINEARSEIADDTTPVAVSESPGSFRYTWTQANLSTTLSVALNDWPDDFIEEISLFYVGEKRPLTKIDSAYYDHLLYGDINNLQEAGDLWGYINRGTKYELVPAPTDSPLYLRYYAYPVALSGSADEKEIDKKVPTLIIAAAALKGARHLHDVELMAFFVDQIKVLSAAVRNKDKKLRWANRLVRIKTYTDYDMSTTYYTKSNRLYRRY